MPKRYFLKMLFPDFPNLGTIETEVSENRIPLTKKGITELIDNQITMARECGYRTEVTVWVELEDDSQEKINPDDLI